MIGSVVMQHDSEALGKRCRETYACWHLLRLGTLDARTVSIIYVGPLIKYWSYVQEVVFNRIYREIIAGITRRGPGFRLMAARNGRVRVAS